MGDWTKLSGEPDILADYEDEGGCGCLVIILLAIALFGLFDSLMDADAASQCAYDGPQASEAVCRQAGVIR